MTDTGASKITVTTLSELAEIIQAPLINNREPPIIIIFQPEDEGEPVIITGTQCANGNQVDISAQHCCICDVEKLDQFVMHLIDGAVPCFTTCMGTEDKHPATLKWEFKKLTEESKRSAEAER